MALGRSSRPPPRGVRALGSLVASAVLALVPPWGERVLAAEGAASAPAAQDRLGRIAEWITSGLEVAGIAAILLGVLATTAVFLRNGFRTDGGWVGAYERYRADLGRAILLGLELLVAADIVGTVAAPLALRNVAALGLIVLILSFSLEVEIKGRWPWRKGQEGQRRRPPSGGQAGP
jgi:uncharacterized membrane protein